MTPRFQRNAHPLSGTRLIALYVLIVVTLAGLASAIEPSL